MNVTEEQILEAIPKVLAGLNRYENIQYLLNNGTPVSEREFQKLFNGFYRIRARSNSWYESFYSVFENAKNEDWTFNVILTELYEKTGRFEASFASKIRASIDINAAIIDKIVLNNVGLNLPKANENNRMSKIFNVYEKLNIEMNRILLSSLGEFTIREFNKVYPNSNISKIKKLDLTLWQVR